MYVPQVYDGRNKTFFFVDFNVTLASQGGAYSGLVPTDLQKSGDFSQTFAGGQPGADLRSHHRAPGGRRQDHRAQSVSGKCHSGQPHRSGGGADCAVLPEPERQHQRHNYFVTPPSQNDNWQYLGRMDQNFGANDRAFFRFGQYSPNNNAVVDIPNQANNRRPADGPIHRPC